MLRPRISARRRTSISSCQYLESSYPGGEKVQPSTSVISFLIARSWRVVASASPTHGNFDSCEVNAAIRPGEERTIEAGTSTHTGRRVLCAHFQTADEGDATMTVARQPENRDALPVDWDRYWGSPAPFYRKELRALKAEFEHLASTVDCADEAAAFSHLVHPFTNRVRPVHRWFHYKEAFAPELAREIVGRLGAGNSGVVVDPFAGVATTQLALQLDPRIQRVLGVEYSPLAHFIGKTKLGWAGLRADYLDKKASDVLRFKRRTRVTIPELAAFHDNEILPEAISRDLASARDRIREVSRGRVRDFFLLGLAAVVEDVSGAAKDGRALRISRNRMRRSTSLAGEVGLPVRSALRRQYDAMLADLRLLGDQRSTGQRAPVNHLRGDARDLSAALQGEVEPQGVGLFMYSPPYLNCIDYTEVYKLELWLLEFVSNQQQFRNVRLGTLRSHPSVEFPTRNYISGTLGVQHNLTYVIRAISSFVERHHVRPVNGRVIWNYFDDMTKVLQEQYQYLEPGGHAACIVANSTFSSRDRQDDGTWVERWRLPILTDVLLAHIAKAIGFDSVNIWRARDLQPRNVLSGAARESLIVMRKA